MLLILWSRKLQQSCCDNNVMFVLFFCFLLLMPALLSVENWVPLKPVCNSLVILLINASEGSLCFRIFILHNSRCHVLCGSCKKLPRTSLQLLFPDLNMINKSSSCGNWRTCLLTYYCWDIVYIQHLYVYFSIYCLAIYPWDSLIIGSW
jgi:hypothetical protein